MSFAADDTESIARRLKELEAEKQLALTGSSAPVDGQEPKTEAGWKSVPGYTPFPRMAWICEGREEAVA